MKERTKKILGKIALWIVVIMLTVLGTIVFSRYAPSYYVEVRK